MDLLRAADKKKCGFTQLTRSITTDELAIRFFQDLGLLKTTRATCDCGGPTIKTNKKNMKLNFMWTCVNQRCGKTLNPLRNTMFERSHLTFLQVNYNVFTNL